MKIPPVKIALQQIKKQQTIFKIQNNEFKLCYNSSAQAVKGAENLLHSTYY